MITHFVVAKDKDGSLCVYSLNSSTGACLAHADQTLVGIVSIETVCDLLYKYLINLNK